MRLPVFLAVYGIGIATGAQAQSASSPMGDMNSQIEAIYPRLESLYVDLHRNPELAFQESRTSKRLATEMRNLGFDVTAGVGRTGVVAILRNGSGPVLMLRTEIDALPVEEKTGLPYSSTVKARNAAGQTVPVMHACGHDLHMAAWIGTAMVLARNRSLWSGTLMMVGQPAEETLSGARAMIEDGLLTRFPRPDFALSFHDDDTLSSGVIGYRPGLFRAMSDAVTITVYGRGGHAAMPHNTIDPVVLASKIVLGLQTIVSRENNPVDPVVITVGSIQGGSQGNVIPDEVKLLLSVRTYTEMVRTRTLAASRRVAEGEALAAGAVRPPQVDVPARGNATVYNDPALISRLAESFRTTLGTDRVVEMPQKMTSEDFAEYGLAGVPIALLHIGAVDATRLAEARAAGNPLPAPHSPEWSPDLEPTLKGFVSAEVTAALTLLSRSN